MLCFILTWVLHLSVLVFFFLMIRRPPRSTLDRSSAASDVYKRQEHVVGVFRVNPVHVVVHVLVLLAEIVPGFATVVADFVENIHQVDGVRAVSYTHLRAHETVLDLVCRLLLEKKKNVYNYTHYSLSRCKYISR